MCMVLLNIHYLRSQIWVELKSEIQPENKSGHDPIFARIRNEAPPSSRNQIRQKLGQIRIWPGQIWDFGSVIIGCEKVHHFDFTSIIYEYSPKIEYKMNKNLI